MAQIMQMQHRLSCGTYRQNKTSPLFDKLSAKAQ
ncbi:hypothetical protein RR11_2194 [Ruegeria sp. R11]|nr:hypothetical protein RR11_2194 [Ruegeria sp. R11]